MGSFRSLLNRNLRDIRIIIVCNILKPRRRIQSLLLSPKSIKPETHRQCKRNSKAERDDNRRAALDPLLHLPDQHQNRVYRLGYRNWDIVKPRKSHHCCGFYLLLARSPVKSETLDRCGAWGTELEWFWIFERLRRRVQEEAEAIRYTRVGLRIILLGQYFRPIILGPLFFHPNRVTIQ